jgi:hypothetical protein
VGVIVLPDTGSGSDGGGDTAGLVAVLLAAGIVMLAVMAGGLRVVRVRR